MAWTSFVPASSVTVTLTNSNLTAASTGTSSSARSEDTFRLGSSNKFYFEITLNNAPDSNWFCGIAGTGYVFASTSYAGCLASNGTIYINGASSGVTVGSALVSGDVLCCAFDLQSEQCWFRRNAGNWNNSASASPATCSGGVAIPAAANMVFLAPFARFGASGTQITANFGASAFAQAVPSGFTSGWLTSAGTTALATQVAVEAWVGNTPNLVLSEVALEMFGAFIASPRAYLTQYAVEAWTAVPAQPVEVSKLNAYAVLFPPPPMTLSLAATERRDVAHFVLTPPSLTLAATEQRDVASFIALAGPAAKLAATEQRDIASFQTFAGPVAILRATEQRDVAAFVIKPSDNLHFALTDAHDSAVFELSASWSAETSIFPVFPGLGFPVQRRPNWRTVIAPHPSGGEQRTALWTYPLWEFELTFDGLTASKTAFTSLIPNSYQELLGFYLAHGGQLTTFLFTDPIFNQQIGGPCGGGDGTTTAFLFMRTIGGAVEPASWVLPTPTVYLNGVVQPTSTWQLVPPNNLVFLTPPGAGAAITADFRYMFTCRFADDTGDYEQMMINLFDMKSLKLRQVRLT